MVLVDPTIRGRMAVKGGKFGVAAHEDNQMQRLPRAQSRTSVNATATPPNTLIARIFAVNEFHAPLAALDVFLALS